MVSKIEICNLALAQLGQGSISSLTQEDEKSRLLHLFYDPVKEEVLRTHNWAFACAQESLALIEEAENTPYRYIYKYPSDALFIRNIFGAESYGGRKNAFGGFLKKPLPFKEYFRKDLHMRVLAVGAKQAKAEYTRRISDENLFDSAFVKAFSLALACDLAVALTGDNDLAQRLLSKYMLCLDEARRCNMTEENSVTLLGDTFSEVR